MYESKVADELYAAPPSS